jgi:HAD superfamily hydrolase (TIGR01509 family)
MKAFTVKAVLFDFDGTLTRPGALDFSVIRNDLNCPADTPVLEFITGIKPFAQQNAAREKLEQFEMEAAVRSRPARGAEQMIARLKSRGLPLAIISRNCRRSIERALDNFKTTRAADFDLIISRDDPISPKPSPDGILEAAQVLNVRPDEILVAGDFIFDIQAGYRAGAVTVFLDNNPENAAAPKESDFIITGLGELERLVRMGIPLPAGKLPNDLLKSFLAQLDINDPAVIIKPGVGEDTAAIDVADEQVLVLKSDPITFATDAIGHYAVLVNANDIATSGAVPRWFLTTIMVPCGITPSLICCIMSDLQTMCRRWNITLCGGHTEITDAVTRPVVSGMLAGTVARQSLIDKRNMRPGDRILLTKAIAVEGTAIIAREFAKRLSEKKMSETEIETCQGFLSRISIIDEARIAAGLKGVSAMHDVTEGGLASALTELGIAGGNKLEIDMDQIPVYPETEKICRLLGIDPMGLIGSGSLLICCRQNVCDRLEARIRDAGIQVTCIGKALEAGHGIVARQHHRRVAWPEFKVDEITRLFQE